MVCTIDIHETLLSAIGAVADKNGVEAYVVGGYVRNRLLDRHVTDLDVVVVGDGVNFAKLVAAAFHREHVVTYEKFGTAMVQLDGTKVEFVGARKESYQKNSRKPDVERGSLDDDLARRDFTINAMAASLNAPRWGEVVDPFDGQRDLARRIIRTPLEPDRTFNDDPLRIMRAIRFASQLGFVIDTGTLDAIRRMKERLSIMSQERITDEFLKILMSSKPSVGLKLMINTGVMDIVFPEISQLSGVDQRKDYHHKDVLYHTLQVVDKAAAQSDKLWLRFTSLVHDIAKPRTKAFKEGIGWTFHGHEELGARMMKDIFRRLRLPMEPLKYVEKLIRLHLRPMALVDEGVTDSAVRRLLFDAGEDVEDLIILCRGDITSKNPALVNQIESNYDNVVRRMREIEEKDRIRAWQPPVRGDEIMEACGLTPGPLVGKLKRAVEEAILDGKVPNEHDAALEYLLSIKDSMLGSK
jgi:tRNA nucleotidyltransferase/poly(A) polymerase